MTSIYHLKYNFYKNGDLKFFLLLLEVKLDIYVTFL